MSQRSLWTWRLLLISRHMLTLSSLRLYFKLIILRLNKCGEYAWFLHVWHTSQMSQIYIYAWNKLARFLHWFVDSANKLTVQSIRPRAADPISPGNTCTFRHRSRHNLWVWLHEKVIILGTENLVVHKFIVFCIRFKLHIPVNMYQAWTQPHTNLVDSYQ